MVNEKNSKLSIWKICAAGVLLTAALNRNVIAAVDSLNLDQVKQGLDTVWVLLGAFLVFFMQAGFGMVEAEFERVYPYSNRRKRSESDWLRIDNICKRCKTNKKCSI